MALGELLARRASFENGNSNSTRHGLVEFNKELWLLQGLSPQILVA